MFGLDNYAAVRRFVFTEGHSRREAARVFGLSRETVLKMCRFSLPPGYTRKALAAKPKLGALLPVIGGVRQKIHFFGMDLPQSDACFVKAYPRKTPKRLWLGIP